MDQNGFTLIEMMIAMAISLLVLSGVYEVFTSQQKAYSTQNRVAEMQQNARVAMDIMTREIKMAGYIAESWDENPGTVAPVSDIADNPPNIGNGTPEDIDESGPNSITIEADIDGDGRTETVRYSLSGGNLVRAVWEWDITETPPWQVESAATAIAENINALTFTYLDSSGAVTATRGNIRLIRISITATTNKGVTDRTRTLTANVRPRNLGL